MHSLFFSLEKNLRGELARTRGNATAWTVHVRIREKKGREECGKIGKKKGAHRAGKKKRAD